MIHWTNRSMIWTMTGREKIEVNRRNLEIYKF